MRRVRQQEIRHQFKAANLPDKEIVGGALVNNWRRFRRWLVRQRRGRA